MKKNVGRCHLGLAKGNEEAVGTELDVLTHEVAVHAQQRHGQRICQKLS